MTGYVETVCMRKRTWGSFLQPDPSLAGVQGLHELLRIPILSGHRADLAAFAGASPTLDQIAARIASIDLAYEDQCSTQHYVDLFMCVERGHTELSRIVDVGVFMGGSATLFAGCAEPMGLELDLVDVSQTYLQFAFERIRRTFPEAVGSVRMFHGDLPTYVHTVLAEDASARALIHHDGAHDFNQVVKDLSSLSFARDRIYGLAIQDTHLRGDIKNFNFVDAAVYGVFGFDVQHEPLGARYDDQNMVTSPNQWNRNYFLPDTYEGMFIPFSGLEFTYPHPSMTLEEFLPTRAAAARYPAQGRGSAALRWLQRQRRGPLHGKVAAARSALRRGGIPELVRSTQRWVRRRRS